MLLSLIVPVYNRPQEVDELLASLRGQAFQDYELIIVEDGSTLPAADVVEAHRAALLPIPLRYLSVANGGPSRARNIGAKVAEGEYLLILDSDVVLPPNYLDNVAREIAQTRADAFGGADAASPDFSPMQKAVNFAMTSLWTTGGIRGAKAEAMEQFKPRTFNMGCRRNLFLQLGGFSEDMRYGEDIDFSLRLIEAGAKVCLFPSAFVYHKRRVDLKKFFMQVHHSGEARIALERRHPGSTRAVHYLPAVFTLYCALAVLSVLGLFPLLLYSLLLFGSAYKMYRDVEIALWSVIASYVQLLGYGTGFLKAKLLNTK